jgi:hypothetical protein
MIKASRNNQKAVTKVIALTCFFCTPVIVLSAGSVLIQVPRPIIEMKNKGIVTVPFIVSNESGKTQLFEEKIDLPEGWQLMSDSIPFRLQAGQRDTRLIHVYAPARGGMGNVSLGYNIVSRTDRSLRQSTKVQIRVRGITAAGLDIKSLPSSVIAGSKYQVRLKLTNTGNQTDDFIISVHDGRYGYISKITPKHIRLKSGAETEIVIDGKIPANLKYSTRYPLRIKVGSRKSKLELYKDINLSLVSRKPVGVGKYHTIPSKLILRSLGKKSTGKFDEDNTQSRKTQLEFTGVGVLDDKAQHHIEFDLRMQKDPLVANSTAFGLDEKYKLRYWNKKLAIDVGDFSYNLGQLLGGNYGRGLGIEYKQENWWIKAARLQSIDNISSEGSYGVSGGYRFDNGFDVGLSLSQKEKKGKTVDYVALQVEYTYQQMRITTELASNNKSANAILLDVSGHYDKLSYDIRTRQINSGFENNSTGNRQISISGSYPIGEHLTVTLGSNYRRSNLDNDLSSEIKESKENYLRLGYDLWESRAGHLFVEGFQINEKDLRTASTLNTQEKGYKIEYRHQFDDWNTAIRHENANTRDKLTGKLTPTKRNELRLGYVPENEDYQISTFIENIETDKDESRTNYGLSGSWNLSQKTRLSGYWRKGLVDSGTVYNSDFYELKATHKFNNGLELGLRASRSLSEEEDQKDRSTDTTWMLELSIPLDIPFRKRENIGSASGKVISARSHKPIANAIVDMKGMSAVTDKQGNFSFPDIYAGDYELNVDLSHLDNNNYSTTSGEAIKIKVKPDKESKIIIPLIAAASLSGVVAYAGKADETLPGDSLRGKDGLLVTLTRLGVNEDNAKVYKRLTMDGGNFSFYGIPPGRWKVQVLDPENVLDRERIDQAVREVNLFAGKKATMAFNIISWTQDLQDTGPTGGFTVESD